MPVEGGCVVSAYLNIDLNDIFGLGEDVLMYNGASHLEVRVCDGTMGVVPENEFGTDVGQEGLLPHVGRMCCPTKKT